MVFMKTIVVLNGFMIVLSKIVVNVSTYLKNATDQISTSILVEPSLLWHRKKLFV